MFLKREINRNVSMEIVTCVSHRSAQLVKATGNSKIL